MPSKTLTRAVASSKNGTPTASVTPEASTETPVKDLLDSYGFTYEFTTLDIASIDRKQSERNQARIAKPIDEDQVLLYAEQMTKGAKFPPIVVYRKGNAYIVMDGNHRVAAADMSDITSLAAYVVNDPSPAQVTTFTYEANTRHGLPTSLKDRIVQAIHMVESGNTLVQSANQLGIPEGQLRSAYDLHEAEKRFSGLGITKFNRLSATARRRLDTIPNDVVLKAAADLVIDGSIAGDDLVKMTREINAVKSSEAAQLGVVETWRKQRASTIKATAGGRLKVAQPLTTFSRVTSTLNRTNVETLSKHFAEVPSEARDEYVRSAAQSVEKLMAIITALRKADLPTV